jgi:hypothetical protein
MPTYLMLEDGHSIQVSFAPQQKPGISEIPGFLGFYSRVRNQTNPKLILQPIAQAKVQTPILSIVALII